jgi:hypothetical protein
MRMPDKKALKILRKFSLTHPERTSAEDFAYAKAAGLMFDDIAITHDEAVAWALREFAAAEKASVVQNFLAGLGRNAPHLRAALSAHAIMTHFPNHACALTDWPFCWICGAYPTQTFNRSFANRCRWAGAVTGLHEPQTLAFYLQQHNQADVEEVSGADIDLLCALLDLIASSPANETPTKLARKVRALAGMTLSVEQAQCVLETLGYAGILQNPEHPGFIYRHMTCCFVPHKSHHSDWAYPIDFWTGKDGVNADALKFWFAAYPQIANWSPQ